jgi:hypothetical protein
MAERHRSREVGQVIIVTAILLPVLVGLVGIAVDVGMLMNYRTQEQRAADAAALAGAHVLLTTGDKTQARAEALAYAKKHGYIDSEISVHLPPVSGRHVNDDKYVEVKISREGATFFIAVLGITKSTVQARAVGGMKPLARNYALIVLNKTQCNAYNHSSSNDLKINGGGAIVNSDASTGGSCVGVSASQGGGSVVTADNCRDQTGTPIPCTLDYYLHGNWQQSNNATSTPPPTPVGTQFPDPLAGLTRPIPCTNGTPGTVGTQPSGCNVPISPTACGNNAIPCATNRVSTANQPRLTSPTTGNITLSPGVYYGGLKLTGSATVTFQPGLYVFAGGGVSQGGFTFNSNAPATGNGVTFFNTGDPYASNQADRGCGAFSIAASGLLNIKAPPDLGTLGPLDDTSVANGIETMLFWQDDRTTGVWAGNCTETFRFTGSGATLAGVIYLPTAKLDMSGGGSLGALQIVVDTFDFSGSSDISINYTRYFETEKPSYALIE